MKKTLYVTYGVLAYLAFLGVYLYLVAFDLNFVPNSVSAPGRVPAGLAVTVDVAVILAFGLQHSIMARSSFKRVWTRIIPVELERSTYVWFGTAMAALIVWGWQPIDGTLWTVNGGGRIALIALSLAGWFLVPGASFLTDHFYLFGLRQVWWYAKGQPQAEPVFRMRGLYRNVRHPMMLGFLIGVWATPDMTLGHLLFAGMMSAYILAGIYFEERSLIAEHGGSYLRYRASVPKLIPSLAPTEAPRDASPRAKHAA